MKRTHDQGRPVSPVPPARATALFARTVYRELLRADYTREDVMRFVGEMLDCMTQDARDEMPKRRSSIVDPQTGIPNAGVAAEVVDFEIRRARAGPGPQKPLLLVSLEVALPARLTGVEADEVHVRVAQMLRQLVRSTDSFARLDSTRYLLVLPMASADIVEPLRRRLAAPLAPHRSKAQRIPEAVAVDMRWASLDATTDPAVQTADDLIARCLDAPPVPVLAGARMDSTLPRPDSILPASFASLPPPPCRRLLPPTERSVVLALGGGAAGAVAHAGVLRALRRAGIHVAGLAGTNVGALVGAMVLSGLAEDEVVDRFTELSRSPVYTSIRRAYLDMVRSSPGSMPPTRRSLRPRALTFAASDRLHVVHPELYAELFEHLLGPDRDISTLAAPFATCATDLVDGTAVVLAHGSLHATLRASCAVPGLFPPEHDGGRVLVDGALACEVPVLAAAHLRVPARTLAVYLESPFQRTCSFANGLEIAERASDVVRRELVREQLRHTELVVSVALEEAWFDLRNAGAAARAGEHAGAAVAAHLHEILEHG